jgi:pimeloyl-ACP methyl ester carboxylesterase
MLLAEHDKFRSCRRQHRSGDDALNQAKRERGEMAEHIDGPLYYERMGRSGPVMAFVHPNPMDQSCWIFQMAQLSTWYRCIAIDIPGYGRSPKAGAGLAMQDTAQACWEAIDDVAPREKAILVGCSVGSAVVTYMHHRRPQQTAALILSGTGYNPSKEFAHRRIKAYNERGIDYRWDYTFDDFSPAFRATPMARFFADMFAERSPQADLQTIIHQFEAHAQPDAEDHQARVACPTIILSGSEDATHQSAFALQARIPGCEMKILPGAGHACQIEQPWLFNRLMIEFLTEHGLFPSGRRAGGTERTP